MCSWETSEQYGSMEDQNLFGALFLLTKTLGAGGFGSLSGGTTCSTEVKLVK